jgi:hypothetical protein
MQTTASVVVSGGHDDDDEREGFEFFRGAGESEGAREEI